MTKFEGVFRVLTALGVLLALSLAPADASTGGKIAGAVKDATTGDGLPHANVVVVDTKLGATADEKGPLLYSQRTSGHLHPQSHVYRLRGLYRRGCAGLRRPDYEYRR